MAIMELDGLFRAASDKKAAKGKGTGTEHKDAASVKDIVAGAVRKRTIVLPKAP